MWNPRDLPLIAVFASVARNQSFTGAARELGFTKSMVSAQVRALEARCDGRLLDRTTRSLHLTSLGQAVFSAAEKMLAEARNIESAVSEHGRTPTGRLAIGVPHGLAALVAGVVAMLVRDYSGMTVSMLVDDQLHDLVEQKLDVVVRIGAPRDSAYVIRRLTESTVVLVAGRSLGLSAKARPSDLGTAPWVAHSLIHRGARWSFTGPRGERETIRPTVRVTANTMEAFRALLLAGAGVGAIPEAHVSDELQSGALMRVCVGWERRRVAIFALVAGRKVPLHVEVFLRALREALTG